MTADRNRESNSSVISDDLRPPAQKRPAEVDRPETHQSSLTFRERILWAGQKIAVARNWLLDFLVPPKSLMERPPGWSELTAYAYRGDWTASPRGFLRGLATIWLGLVAFPVVCFVRGIEWLATRPSRALSYTVIWQILIRTDAGQWVAGGIAGFFHLLAVLFAI